MKHWVRGAVVAIAAVAGVLGLAACEEVGPTSQEQEAKRRQNAYDTLSENQPAGAMEYSPTRESVNGWIDTWGKDPNKLAYVYVQLGGGGYGYMIMKGPPVSMCTMLTPNYEIHEDSYGNVVVPAPGMDGAYHSGAGSCNTYYGFDAESGAYLEFTVGEAQSYFLYSEPQDLPGDLIPMGDTTL